MEASAPRRHFLFLQGPSSLLFRRVGDRLEAAGHRVTRVNICAGDWVFWHDRRSRNFRGRAAAWPAYLARLYETGITDIVLLGEERPYHLKAVELARRHRIDVYVVEMGYLRPDWVTIERGGMSGNSHFPNDPAAIRRAAAGLGVPDMTRRFTQNFLAEAGLDLAYNLPNVFLRFFFPHFRAHAIDHPLAEYAGWLRRLARRRARMRAAHQAMEELRRDAAPYFVLPLQLETDYQVRAHSPFPGQREALERVFSAFARAAPRDCRLLVKSHPLDNGLRDWSAICRDLAARHGLAGRVFFIDAGRLDDMLAASRGMVTINSTAGLQALAAGLPVKVLGTAIYDVAGLTDPRPLDAFFSAPRGPDAELRAAFFALLAEAIHVRGNFYSRRGSRAAARAIAVRLDARNVNEPGAFVDPPPRKVRGDGA